MKLNKEDKELIKKAGEAIKKAKAVNLIDTGETGAALITSKGTVFRGVNLGFYCGIGSCAEYQAIGAMVSSGEKVIKKIVAVWEDEKKGYEIVPPCGNCREMMLQASKANKDTEVIVSNSRKVKLKALMPYHWKGSIER